jgi:hypothetical protein
MPGLGEPVKDVAGGVRFIFYDETTHPAASRGLNAAASVGVMSTFLTDNGGHAPSRASGTPFMQPIIGAAARLRGCFLPEVGVDRQHA